MVATRNIVYSGFQRTRPLHEVDNTLDIPEAKIHTLQITPSKPGLHEKAESIAHRPVYRISRFKKPLRFLGMKIPGNGLKRKGGRKYIKLLPLKSRIPKEAHNVYDSSSNIERVKEMALYLSTDLGNSKANALLAIQVENRWYEVYQWKTSWNELGIFRSNL